MTRWIFAAVVFVLIIAVALALVFTPAPKNTSVPGTATSTMASLDDTIVVTSPLPNASISSTTIIVTGKARGNWFFEAVAPVLLKNSEGNILAQGQIRALGDWTTTDYVEFEGTLTFAAQTPGSAGTLVFKNDNPSGDPVNQEELDVPVVFK